MQGLGGGFEGRPLELKGHTPTPIHRQIKPTEKNEFFSANYQQTDTWLIGIGCCFAFKRRFWGEAEWILKAHT